MLLNRYQTYVFDTKRDEDPTLDPARRNLLGEDYKGAPPCAWSDGDALLEKEKLQDFVRDIVENGYTYGVEEITELAQRLMDELNF